MIPMKDDIVLIGPLLDTVMHQLDDLYTVHRYFEAENPGDLLASIAGQVRAVVTDGGRGVKAAVLKQLPKCEIVSVFGVGVDAVDLDYCRSAGIAVTNTPDVLSDDVADLAVALMLAVSRNVVGADHYVRSGRWQTEGAMPLTSRMSGKKAGIFGMGSIGLRLCKRLEAFDMDVAYCNRRRRSDVQTRYISTLDELAKDSDYLIITASASSATDKIINAEILEALGNEGILVNISRGSLIDQPALIQALGNKTIKAAGLDVFDDEPNVPESLVQMDNVVLQPHQASATHETRKAMGKMVADNLDRFFSGRPLLTEYTR